MKGEQGVQRTTQQQAEESGQPSGRSSGGSSTTMAALAMQRSAGNRATVQLLRTTTSPLVVQTSILDLINKPRRWAGLSYGTTIEGESVRVANPAEEEEARRLILELKNTYGVKASSTMTIAAMKAEYDDVPAEVTEKLIEGEWELKELRAAVAAASHFAPIMGGARETSTLAHRTQGVTTIGRVKRAIDFNSPEGQIEVGEDDLTMGEHFGKERAVGMFDALTDEAHPRYPRPVARGADNATTLEATAIHEMCHGLIEPTELGSFVAAMAFWSDQNTPSGDAGAESPPTEYGLGNAKEDLAESVALFFVNRAKLHVDAPDRERFIAAVVAGWASAEQATLIDQFSEG